MLQIKNHRIRRVDLEDSQFMIDLRSDMSVSNMLGNFVCLNRQSQLKWLESLNNKSDLMYFIFEGKNNNVWEKIGIVRISDLDLINRNACIGGDIIENFRGQGLSKKMYELIFTYCFGYLNLNRLWLLVLENNNVAINLYKKLGFITEGTQRKAIFRKGTYLDYIMMSILKDEITIKF